MQQNGPKVVDGADVIVIKDGNKTGIVKKTGQVTIVSLPSLTQQKKKFLSQF